MAETLRLTANRNKEQNEFIERRSLLTVGDSLNTGEAGKEYIVRPIEQV